LYKNCQNCLAVLSQNTINFKGFFIKKIDIVCVCIRNKNLLVIPIWELHHTAFK
jgi:hypothetical protein